MLKRIISVLVLAMYLHGMSGYTMSFHKCNITGFENVYTGFGISDPCNEEEELCRQTAPHFEQANCCDVQHTVISVDDDSNISYFKTEIGPSAIVYPLIQSYFLSNSLVNKYFYAASFVIKPPEPCIICVFRI